MSDEARTVYVVAGGDRQGFTERVLGVFSTERGARQYVERRGEGTGCPRGEVCSCGLDAEVDALFGDRTEYLVLLDLHGGRVLEWHASRAWGDLRVPLPDDQAWINESGGPDHDSPHFAAGCSYLGAEQALQLAVQARSAWLAEHGMVDSCEPPCLGDERPSEGGPALDVHMALQQHSSREGCQPVYVVMEVNSKSDALLLPDGVFSTEEKAQRYVADSRRPVGIHPCVVDAEESATFGERTWYHVQLRLDDGEPWWVRSFPVRCHLGRPLPGDQVWVATEETPPPWTTPPSAAATTYVSSEHAMQLARRVREDWLSHQAEG